MKEHKRRIEEVLRILCLEMKTQGKFQVVVETFNELDPSRLEMDLEALILIKEACWRALLIGLAGMLSTDQESITMKYLLDLADNHPYDFDQLGPQEVKRLVVRSREELESIAGLESRLRAIRDQRLAHLDRKQLNEPGVNDTGSIGIRDLAEGLGVVEKVLERLTAAYGLDCGSFMQSNADFRTSLSLMLFRPGTGVEVS